MHRLEASSLHTASGQLDHGQRPVRCRRPEANWTHGHRPVRECSDAQATGQIVAHGHRPTGLTTTGHLWSQPEGVI